MCCMMLSTLLRDSCTGWGLHWAVFVDDDWSLLHPGPNSFARGGHRVPSVHHEVPGRDQRSINDQECNHGSLHFPHVPAGFLHDSRPCQPRHTLHRKLRQAVRHLYYPCKCFRAWVQKFLFLSLALSKSLECLLNLANPSYAKRSGHTGSTRSECVQGDLKVFTVLLSL